MERVSLINKSDNQITVIVNVLLLKEDDIWVAYCPALDLSSYGDNEDEAKDAFHETVDIFIQETERKGTLEKVLLSLGWTLRKAPKAEYCPPKLPGVYKQLLSQGALKLKEQVSLPV